MFKGGDSYRGVFRGEKQSLAVSPSMVEDCWSLVDFQEMVALVVEARPVDVDDAALHGGGTKVSYLRKNLKLLNENV